MFNAAPIFRKTKSGQKSQPDFVDYLSIVLYALFMKNASGFFEQNVKFMKNENLKSMSKRGGSF